MKWLKGFLSIVFLLSLVACGPGATIMPEDTFPPAAPTPYPTIIYPEPPATAVPRPDPGDSDAYPPPGGGYSGPSEVTWDTAQDLIMRGEVVEVFQAHSLEVELVLVDGQRLTTIEPQIDEVFKVIERCGARCADVVIVTE